MGVGAGVFTSAIAPLDDAAVVLLLVVPSPLPSSLWSPRSESESSLEPSRSKLPVAAVLEPIAPGLTLVGVVVVVVLLLSDVGVGPTGMPATSLAPSVPGDGPTSGVGVDVDVLCALVHAMHSAANRVDART